MKSVLAIIPIKPQMNPQLKWMAMERAYAMVGENPALDMGIFIDARAEPSQPGDCRVWSKVARVRNKVLGSIDLAKWDYLLWIDADIIEYPPDLPARLIEANPEGMTAPIVLVEESNRFYDWAAFIIAGKDSVRPADRSRIVGRNLQHEPPYWPEEPKEELVEMACVGAVTMVPTWVYRQGVTYLDHPAFTDHYPIARFVRDCGKRVICHRGVKVAHAELPRYGEAWH